MTTICPPLPEFADLTDVHVTGEAGGDLLWFNGTDSKWERIAAGTAGHLLQTNGTSSIPTWVAAAIGLPGGAAQGDVLYEGASSAAWLAPGTSGYFLQTQGAGQNPQWAQAALSGLSDVSLSGAAQGDILIRGASGWINLAHGTSGQVLTTNGAGANASWTTPSTGSSTFAGLSDVSLTSSAQGDIYYDDGTHKAVNLAAGTSGYFLQTQGASANPHWAQAALSGLSDVSLSGTAQGDVLYRGASGWNNLAHGTNGQFLQTQGASANPQWATPALSGLSDVTLSGTAQGDILIRGASGWINLAHGTSGYVLTTNGASANPSWTAASGVSTFAALTDVSLTSSAQGDIYYDDGTHKAVNLAAGTAGQLLMTGGASANPAWCTLQGMHVVRVATTANGTLSTAFAAGQVVDGVTLSTSDRILIKNQSTQSQNGIYVVGAGTPTRAADMPTGSDAAGAVVFVDAGTVNTAAFFVCTASTGSSVGTTSLPFTVSIPQIIGSNTSGAVVLNANTSGTLFETTSTSTVYFDTGNNDKFHFNAARGQVGALGTQSTAATLNGNNGNIFTLTTSGTCALTISNLDAGQSVRLYVTQGSGGSHTVTFSGVKFPGGSTPTWSTAAGAIDCIVLENDGTNTYGYAAGYALA